MPVPWFLLSLALGRSPVVISLERLVGPQDTARCSPDLSCHLWDGDMLCLPGNILSAPGPVLVPTLLQTELVLRCRQQTDCDLCVRVTVHLAVQLDQLLLVTVLPMAPGLTDSHLLLIASLQAQVVISFQAYPTARCALLEVQVPATLVQPGQSVGSVVFDCFEAGLGAEVRIWSYTQPRYQKELNLTQQLPDGDNVCLVLDVPERKHFGLLLYWDQVQGPLKPWWHRNLTGPQTITLNHTDLVPCLCIQLWPLEPDSVRTNFCPFQKDPRAHRNLWHAARLQLLPSRSWRLSAPCSLSAEVTLCWQASDQSPCLAVPLLPRENVTVNVSEQVSSREKVQLQVCLWSDSLGPFKNDMLLVESRGLQNDTSLCALGPSGCTPLPSKTSMRAAHLGEQLLQDLQSGQCLKLWDDDLGALWACPMEKCEYYKNLWLLCHFVRRELSAQGALAWFHAQRRQTLQEGGVVVLLFSPGAVALCQQWLQDQAPGPHDAFAASLSCALPDFLQGRAPGRYLGVCFDGLLHPDDVPAPFRAAPVFSLPSQLPGFLSALQEPGATPPGRLQERAEQVCRALQPALDRYFPPRGRDAGPDLGPGPGLE
uniref:Interleukin 17 receptor C n=1 Tax=Jaculus jaculus TaxID=51337 RepID=A0A8C5K7X9_JACJA